MQKPDDLEHIRQILEGQVLRADDFIKLFRTLKMHDSKNSSKVIQILINEWRIFKQIPDEIKSFIKDFVTGFEKDLVEKCLLITNTNGYNFLHSISELGDIDLLYSSLMQIKELSSSNFLNDLVYSKTSQNYNFLQVLCSSEIKNVNSFEKFIQWMRAEPSLGDNSIKILLSDTTNDNNNLVQVCALKQSVQSMKVIFEFLMQNFLHADIKKWLQSQNVKNENFLQILSNANPNAVPDIIFLMHSKLNDKELLKNILSAKDNSDQTILQNLINRGTHAFLTTLKLKELVEDILKSLKLHQVLLLLKKDIPTLANAMQILKEKLNKEYFSKLFEDILMKEVFAQKKIDESFKFYKIILVYFDKDFIKDSIKDSVTSQSIDLMDAFFEKSESDSEKIIYSFLFLFCMNNENYPHQETLEFQFREMTQTSSIDFLATKSKTGWTFLLTLSQQNNTTSFVEVIKYLASKLDKKFVTELLKAKTDEGWTFVHFLAKNNNKTSFGDLLRLLKKDYDLKFVKEILKSITNQHLTFLSVMSCTNLDRSPVETLQTLFEQFDKIFISELFMIKSNVFGEDYIDTDEGWTFLHHFCKHNDNSHFIEMLQVLANGMDKGLFEKLLDFKNNDGCTFLHYLSQYNDGKYFADLLEILLNKSFVMKLLLAIAYNTDGSTFLHNYCQYNTSPFKDLINILLEKFDDKSFLKALFLVPVWLQPGGTFLHYVCEHNKATTEVFSTLIKVFDKEYIKELFMIKDQNGLTFLQILEQHNRLVFNNVQEELSLALDSDFVNSII